MNIGEFLTARIDALEADVNLAQRAAGGRLWWAAYLLADIAAKRRILALHQPGVQFSELRDAPQYYCATCGSGEPYEYPTGWPCETLLLLTGPFAAHPDFDPAWAVPTS